MKPTARLSGRGSAPPALADLPSGPFEALRVARRIVQLDAYTEAVVRP